jgi:hypothetical protein
VPQWCLTAPCVSPPEEATNAFDVGASPCVELALDDDARCAVDDFEPVAVAAPEPEPEP